MIPNHVSLNRKRWVLLAMLLAACSVAPKPTKPPTVFGFVTDTDTGDPLAGVTVTLRPSTLAPVTTDASGYFIFDSVTLSGNTLLRFEKDGYFGIGKQLESPKVSADGSTLGTATDTIDASVKLQAKPPPAPVDPATKLLFNVGGFIYAGDHVAPDAQVALVSKVAATATTAEVDTYVAALNTGMDGRFTFTGVAPGNYELRVWPYDANKDGVAEYRFTVYPLGDLPSTTSPDPTNLAIHLQTPTTDLLAAGFVGLSTADAGTRPSGFPVHLSELSAGVSAVALTGAELWLHWGAEIDTDLTVFELRQVERSGRASPPLPITVTWDLGVIAHIQPQMPLSASSNADNLFELRIVSLRFKSGTTPWSPTAQAYGKITFSLVEKPDLLEGNPVPSLYVSPVVAQTQVVSQAAVDAEGVWLRDERGDFTSASGWTDSTGLTLSWPHLVGASSYRLYARNGTSTGTVGDNRSQWQPITASIPAVDPSATGRTVIATNVMRNQFSLFGSQTGGEQGPWLFNNSVSIVVTSVDVNGFESWIDPAKALVLRDTTPPFLGNDSDLDYRFGSGDFSPVTARGAAFRAILHVSPSEPVLSGTDPTLVAVGSILSIRQGAATWNGLTATTPVQAATDLLIPVDVRVKGACTELLYSRHVETASTSDFILPVRDRAVIAANADGVVLSSFGQVLAQFSGLNPSGTSDLLAQAVIVPGPVTLPAGSQLCSLAGTSTARLVSVSTSDARDITVNNAQPFSLGATIMFFEPSTCSSATNCTTSTLTQRTVIGIDTHTQVIRVESAIPAAHTTATLVFPWSNNVSALRQARSLSMATDTYAATASTIILTAAPGVLVGDTLLTDEDGNLLSTQDQHLVTVSAINTYNRTSSGTPLVELTTNLGGNTILVKGRAQVIHLGDGFIVRGLQDTSGQTMVAKRNAFAPAGSGTAFVWTSP